MKPALVVRNAQVLTMDPAIGDLDTGDLVVEDGVLTAVTDRADAPPDAEVLDATGCIAIPGFVDTHRHMFQAVLRGCAPQDTLGDYFTRILGTIVPQLTPRDLHVGELLSARAAMASGVTTVQDISNVQDSPDISDALVSALQESGLRAVFAYGNSIAKVSSGAGRLPDDVRRIRREMLTSDDARVTMAVVAEASDDDTERANADLARDLDVRVARHVSEQYPVSRLAQLGALVPGSTFIHGNDLPLPELQAIVDGASSLSVAPAIEMMMGHGYPMHSEAPEGLLISLSTDVEVTVPSDMFTQLRMAYAAARTKQLTLGGARYDTTVYDVLAAATRNGARAVGLGDRTGTLTPGKRADVVLLRVDRPDAAPVIDPYSTVVLQLDRSHVDTVLVDGEVVKRDGRPREDSSDLLDEAARVVRRLREASVLEPNAYPITAGPAAT